MRIFLDTEFTSLEPQSLLISIALVTDDGCFFYAELSDGWTKRDCTPWVQSNVLSKLDHRPETTMPRAEAAIRLKEFLTGFSDAVICFDSEHDRRQLLGLLGSVPAHIRLENIDREIDQPVFEGYFGGRTDLKHHALVDARALEYSFRLTCEMRKRALRDRDDVC